MQVDVMAVVSAVASILSVAAIVIVTLGRIAIANRERELDRRLDEHAKKAESIDTRLHGEEKATIRQDGEIARVRDTHDHLAEVVDEIKREMATKHALVQLERNIERHFAELHGRERPYAPRPTPGRYESVRGSESPLPPKNK